MEKTTYSAALSWPRHQIQANDQIASSFLHPTPPPPPRRVAGRMGEPRKRSELDEAKEVSLPLPGTELWSPSLWPVALLTELFWMPKNEILNAP
jgi:hypothetical protein